MNALQIIFVFAVACLGYPAGMIISNLAREELKQGKKWFLAIIIICAIAILTLTLLLIFVQNKTSIVFLLASFIFIFMMALASFAAAISKQNWKRWK